MCYVFQVGGEVPIGDASRPPQASLSESTEQLTALNGVNSLLIRNWNKELIAESQKLEESDESVDGT